MPLTDADLDAIEARMNICNKRQANFEMNGAQDSVYNPNLAGNAWMSSAVDNKEAMNKVINALSEAEAAIIAAIEALPTGPGGGVTKDDVLAACKQALPLQEASAKQVGLSWVPADLASLSAPNCRASPSEATLHRCTTPRASRTVIYCFFVVSIKNGAFVAPHGAAYICQPAVPSTSS